MSTIQERADEWWKVESRGFFWKPRDMLAAFGQQERERAVKECAEAAATALKASDTITYSWQPVLRAAILAVASEHPLKWCEHHSVLSNGNNHFETLDAFWNFAPGSILPDYSPCCGKPRPRD